MDREISVFVVILAAHLSAKYQLIDRRRQLICFRLQFGGEVFIPQFGQFDRILNPLVGPLPHRDIIL
jgi:hypothetical protein